MDKLTHDYQKNGPQRLIISDQPIQNMMKQPGIRYKLKHNIHSIFNSLADHLQKKGENLDSINNFI